MKIHNIILIIYFESIITFTSNPYKRYFIIPPLIIIDNEEKYKIEHLIKK